MKTIKWIVSVMMLNFILTMIIAAPGQWLHVRVIEAGENGDKIKVNVPMSLIETVLPMLEPEEFKTGKIKIDSNELTVPELREIWNAVRSSGDYEIASIQNKDVDLRITIEGDYFFIRSTEGADNKISVTLPARVVDALFSGEGDQLDVMAAVQELAQFGEGELVNIEDGDTTVKVWIDSSNVPAE